MSDRFQPITFIRVVGAGATATFSVAIPQNYLNVAKIKVIPSDPAINTEFFLYKDSTYAAADLVYATRDYVGDLIDPIEADGPVFVERNEAYVCAYEDKALSLHLYIKIKNNGANPCTYSGEITVDTVYSHAGGSGIISGVPDGLDAKAYASGLKITLGVIARKNIDTIDGAELRAIFVASGDEELPYYDLRTPGEGGAFVHNGVTQLIITGIPATQDGAQYIFTSANPGTWYYTWRLHNTVGWSNWSDGNLTPSRVIQRIDTRQLGTPDAGPPSDWDITLEDGPASNTLVVRVTRPNVNSDIINRLAVQVKEGATGAWTSLFNGPDVDNMKWDGRLIPLNLSVSRNQLTDPSAGGFGTAARGDLVLLDVRGAVWNEQYCQWAVVNVIAGNVITISGFFRPQAVADLRAVIVKPPWAWSSSGYLGGYAGHGMWPQDKSEENLFLGDTKTQEFVTSPIVIPNTVVQPEARVWFENDYSVGDDGINHTVGKAGLPTVKLWTRFNDPRWFVPLYSLPTWAYLTFGADGSCLITPVEPRPALGQPGNIYGVKGHFSVYPDLAGIVKLRAKWTNVTIPQYVDTDYVYECTSLLLGQAYPWSYFTLGMHWLAAWGNYRNNANVRFLQGNTTGDTYLTGLPARPIGAAPGYVDVARPAGGYTLEIKVGFSTGVGVGADDDMAITTCEYRLNSGAWTAIPTIALGKACKYANLVMEGIMPIIGMAEGFHQNNKNLSGWTAKLTEFEVIQGIIRRFRTQSVQ